jgi:hypothetical protein
MPEWNSREKAVTVWSVDSKTANASYEEDDIRSRVKIYVDKYFSNSSLEAGLHTFNIIYWVPFTAGGSGGYYYTNITTANISFEVYPTDITMLVSPGERKLISLAGDAHTFIIRNLGNESVFIKIEKQGDYKNYITSIPIYQFQAFQQEEYIALSPNERRFVDFYTNLPFDVKSGSYKILISFIDRDTNTTKTASINLLVGTGSSLDKLSKILLYPVYFSPHYNFTITKDGIFVKGLSEISFPIGWLLLILAFVVPFVFVSNVVSLRRKDVEKYKTLIIIVVGVLICLAFVIFVVV